MTHLGHSGARASPKSLSTPSPHLLHSPAPRPGSSLLSLWFLSSRWFGGLNYHQVFFSSRESYCLMLCIQPSLSTSSASDLLASEPWQQYSFVQESPMRRQASLLGPVLPWPGWSISSQLPYLTGFLFLHLLNWVVWIKLAVEPFSLYSSVIPSRVLIATVQF